MAATKRKSEGLLNRWKAKLKPTAGRRAKNGNGHKRLPTEDRRQSAGEPGSWQRLNQPLADFLFSGTMWRWTLLIALAAVIALTIYPALFRPEESLRIGEVATRDIKATRTYLIKDEVSTEERRKEARQNQPPVFDLDDAQLSTLSSRTEEAFALLNAKPAAGKLGDEESGATGLGDLKSQFEAALGLELNPRQWQLLIKGGKAESIKEYLIILMTSVSGYNIVTDRRTLLDLGDRPIIIRRLSTGEERLTRNYYPLMDLETLARRLRVEIHGLTISNRDYDLETRRLLLDLAVGLIGPNLTPNRHETEKRRNLVAEAVKPVFYQIRKGEMLVREGELITPKMLIGLRKEASLVRDGSVLMRSAGIFLMVVIFFRVLYMSGLLRRSGRRLAGRDLIFISSIILLVFLLGRAAFPVLTELTKGFSLLAGQTLAPLFPAALAALLIGSILGLEAAILTGLGLSLVLSLLIEPRLEFFAMFAASSIVAAHSALRLRNRGGLVRAGFYAGLTNAAMIAAIRLIGADPLSVASLFQLISGLLGGLLAGVVAAGVFPLVESVFGYTTGFKLLELAHLDHPLLKELLFQAPGSYHHSVVVAGMVEAAAEEIGANPLLAKAAALYHDIGKIKKPLYFIENQSGVNKHERLAPSMSALILISHVKDGVEMARKAKLGRDIEDIIEQHHGTSLIEYFYNKARKAAVDDREKINIDDFRYPGPKPQTKEAGLVMLADWSEAACKSLPEPTPARIKGMVQKLVNRAFSDGQLSDCELTLKDLHAIAKSFIRVLTGLHHQRIAYPDDKSAAKTAKRNANGHSTSKRTSPAEGENGHAEEPDRLDLRRLGA